MERIANGMWMYRKPKLAEITTEKKAKSVKRKVKASKTAMEAEMENALFHYGCICKVCKEFDKFKESKRKEAVAFPALAQVTPETYWMVPSHRQRRKCQPKENQKRQRKQSQVTSTRS